MGEHYLHLFGLKMDHCERLVVDGTLDIYTQMDDHFRR